MRVRRRVHRQRGPDIGLAGAVRDFERLVVHADVVGRHVEHAGVGRERRRLLVLGTEGRRADAFGVGVGAVGEGAELVDHGRTAGLHVDMGRPVDARVVLLGDQQLAGHAVERVGEAVAVEVDQRLDRLALDVDVGEDVLVDAVIVPFVERGLLEHPLDGAGVGVTGEDRHRPLVVAAFALAVLGALRRVPGAGVAGAVVYQVQFGIVGVPAPGGAAADLPLVAVPGRDAQVPVADRLAEHGGLLRVDHDVLVGTGRIGPPDLLAVLDVVGRQAAAHAELAAGDADEDLVLDDHRVGGQRLALAGVAVLDLPHLFAGLGVERHQRVVGLCEEDLAVGIGHAAVDGVAAHHRDHVGVLARLVLPEDAALLLDREGVDQVGERRVDVHDVTDHQRAAFVAAQDAGGEAPVDLQVLVVLRGDLVERAIALARIVAELHGPVVRVLLQLHHFVVGICRAGCRNECNSRKQDFHPAHISSPPRFVVCRTTLILIILIDFFKWPTVFRLLTYGRIF